MNNRSLRFVECRTLSLLAVLSIPFMIGCGGRDPNLPKTAPVTGAVTYNGTKLTAGEVTFIPQGIEGSKPALARIGPDGTYSLTTYDKDDGAAVGKHKVTVMVFPEAGNPGAEAEESPIPEKYFAESTTDLEFEVTEGDNKIDIELKD